MPSSRGSSRPRIKPTSLMSPVLAGEFFTTSATWEARQRWLIAKFLLRKGFEWETSCSPSPPGLRLVVKEDRRWLAGRQAERREKAEILKD